MITALSQLNAQSLIAGYDKTLQARATLKDIYVNHMGLYKRTEQVIPKDIYMKVSDVSTGTNNITITMKLPLTGSVVRGNTRLTGTEEQPNTKSVTVYRNNYKKAVSVETYNTRKLDQQDYGLYKQHIDDLSVWAAQNHGLDIRMAFLRRYSYNLLAGDTAAVCVPQWNPHFYVQGAVDADQPEYDTDDAAYTNDIVQAIVNAGGGSLTPTNNQVLSPRSLNKIAQRALDKLIKPIEIGGQNAFVLVISPEQAAYMSDEDFTPSATTRSGGGIWLAAASLPDKVKNWYGILGKFQSPIGVDIYITVDPKCPTLLPGGTAEPFSLTDNYMWPGDVDLRMRSNTNVRDACYLLGKGALIEWEPEKLHFVKQDDDYFRIMGHGIAGVRGIQLPVFDNATPSSATAEYYGGMVCVFGRPTYN